MSSKLSKRKEGRDKVAATLMGKPEPDKDPDKKINLVVKQSHNAWLDVEIGKYNRRSSRKTNKSEVIRLLLDRLQKDGLESIL